MNNNIIVFWVFILFEIIGISSLKGQTHHVFVTANFADIPDCELQSYNGALKNLFKDNPDFTFLHTGDYSESKVLSDVQIQKEVIKIEKLFSNLEIDRDQLIFLPGDRDWLSSNKEGWKYVKELEKALEKNKIIKWSPGKGCPGPKAIQIADHVLLVLIDTQWWNHPYDKPGPTDADCKIATDADFIEELEDIIGEAGNSNIVFAGHFPLMSNGASGGRNTIKEHLFPLTNSNPNAYIPLPIFGSFYTSFRKNIGTPTDIHNERFDHIRNKLLEVVKSHDNLIYLSGHEKNMQIIREENSFLINSGASYNQELVKKGRNTLYESNHPGLIEIVYGDDGRIDYHIHQYENGSFKRTTNNNLIASPCSDNAINPQNELYIPCPTKGIDDSNTPLNNPNTSNSTITAGAEYANKGLGKVFMGKLYRDIWTTPINLSHLDLDKTVGKLAPLSKGGGVQTLSLKLGAENGKEYVFRSVNKEPIKAIPVELRTGFTNSLVRQTTATQHPYGAIAASKLLDHTNILHARPTLYIMPDDPRLGIYREEFGGMLGMLEDRPMKPEDGGKGSFDSDEILRSYKLFRQLYSDHNNRVSVKGLLESRVFSIWAGDRGRHEENFKWAGFKKDKGVEYFPIPRDRDHIFSKLDGVFPWIIDQPWGLRFFENFDYKIKDHTSLNYSARHLDRYLLSAASRAEWISTAKDIQNTFTDQRIEESIKSMPSEIYDKSGKIIVQKLKQRRKDIIDEVQIYYEILAKEVDVVGSNEREYFEVERNKDGSVSVKMYNLDSFKERKKGNQLIYDRVFFPSETKEIRLYGLGSKDCFVINGEADQSILIRVLGGDGEDFIEDNSVIKKGGKSTLVYEKDEESKIILGTEAKQKHPTELALYDYQRKSFLYNTTMPIPKLSYSNSTGFLLGWGYKITRQKFGKEDYAHSHSISAYYSTQGNLGASYTGRFHHLIKKWDLETAVSVDNPNTFNFFFGNGNETINEEELLGREFYRLRYNTYGGSIKFVRDFFKKSSFSFGVSYTNNQISEPEDIQNNILQDIDVFGENPINIVSGILAFDLDFRDDKHLPMNGMRFHTSYQNGLNFDDGESSNFGKLEGSLEGFTSTRSKHPLTLGVKIGAGNITGDVPFYNKFFFGQTNHLKGFQENRFAGNSMAYLNSELRFQIADTKTSFLPIRWGLSAFFDYGRVFEPNETSDIWHNAYGMGIFVVPAFTSVTVHLSVGFSDEESGAILLGFGTLLN